LLERIPERDRKGPILGYICARARESEGAGGEVKGGYRVGKTERHTATRCDMCVCVCVCVSVYMCIYIYVYLCIYI